MCNCVNRNLIVIGWRIIGKTEATHMRVASRLLCSGCCSISTIEEIEKYNTYICEPKAESMFHSAAAPAVSANEGLPGSSQSTF